MEDRVSRIFLSHSSVNNAEAVGLRDWLVEQGWDDVFLDLDRTEDVQRQAAVLVPVGYAVPHCLLEPGGPLG
jgi:hypothetical protein